LEDSANQFDQELIDKLNTIIVDLKEKVTSNDVVITGSEEHNEGENGDEEDAVVDITLNADNVYIR
jgi:hypothetical protein